MFRLSAVGRRETGTPQQDPELFIREAQDFIGGVLLWKLSVAIFIVYFPAGGGEIHRNAVATV